MEGSISVKTFHKHNVLLQKEIGSGSFGKVYKGVLRNATLHKAVAVKTFFKEVIGSHPTASKPESDLRANVYDELAKVAVLEHENIVRLLGMVQDDIPWLVFEFMKDGNLLEYVMLKKGQVKERVLLGFCRDICNGMTFLHQNNFLHKDLAARNILLDGTVAKIADLGLCSFLTDDHNGSYSLGGKLFPYRHAASECIIESIYTTESDVWSFGVLLFEVFTEGSVPYGSVNKQPEVRRFIADGKNPMDFKRPNCSKEILALMENIFLVRREDRPTFEAMLQYFEGFVLGRSAKLIHSGSTDSNGTKNEGHSLPHHRRNNGSSDPLSSSPPINSSSSLSGFVGTPPKPPKLSYMSSSSRSPTFEDQNDHNLHGSNQFLFPPITHNGARRSSENFPQVVPQRGATLLPVVDHLPDPSLSRRAASYSNIDQLTNLSLDDKRNLLFKDYVHNRFGTSSSRK